MALTFYCGSGSAFACTVWLTLAGDLEKTDYLAVHPRGWQTA